MKHINEYVGWARELEGVSIESKDGNWVAGDIEMAGDTYQFEAKVFSEPSDYGYYHGRLSKISIHKGDEWIFHYDRGMDITTPEGRRVCTQLRKAFPNKVNGR